MLFDPDRGFPAPGFRFGFPVVQGPSRHTAVGANVYVLVTPDGSRVELRQTSTPGVYEAADSSYLRLEEDASTGLLYLRPADGSRLTYAYRGGEYQCTEIKDRHGNFITAAYTSFGQLDRVADTLRRLHRLTQGWPQRPGWRASTDLLHAETGTKIDLGAMPREGVARCRAAWARLAGRQTCVVHGDPNNPGNVRMTADRVALIDWDEAHVDIPDLDLVLPYNAAGLDDGAHDIAAQASAAWEAAVCWDDEYTVKRLAEVRAV